MSHRSLAAGLVALAAAFPGAGAEQQEVEPAPDTVRLAEGIELLRGGRHDAALERLQPLVEAHPDWPAAHLYLGMVYYELHRWETAARLLGRAYALDPGLDEVRLPYGWCLYYLGDLERARRMFEAFLETKPGYLDAVFALGLIDFDDDDVASASKRFRRAIEFAVEQENVGAEALFRARLADVHVRTGELAAARRELERSIELDPSNYKTYFKLSRVLQQLGDVEGARKAHRAYTAARAGADTETSEP